MRLRLLNCLFFILFLFIGVSKIEAQTNYSYNAFIGDTLRITIDEYAYGTYEWQIKQDTSDTWNTFTSIQINAIDFIISDTLPQDFEIKAVYRISDSMAFPPSSEPVSVHVCNSIDDLTLGGFYYQGGILFYKDTLTNTGHITPPHDFTGLRWGCSGIEILGADGKLLWDGPQNTLDILASCPDIYTSAYFCDHLVYNNFSDWYLPSYQELIVMKNSVQSIIARTGQGYKKPSSSEYSATQIYTISFLASHPYDTLSLKTNSSTKISTQPCRIFSLSNPHINCSYEISSLLNTSNLHNLIQYEIDSIYPSDYYFQFQETISDPVVYQWDFSGGIALGVSPNLEYGARYTNDIRRNVSLKIYYNGQLILPEIISKGFHPSIHQYIDPNLGKIEFGSVDYGDYNNDGLVDILATGSNKTLVIKNCGNDSAFLNPDVEIVLDFSTGRWIDYNNDNNLDFMVCGNSVTGCVSKLYRNMGDETFNETGIVFEGVKDGDLECFDYNNDGWMDILIAGEDDAGNPITAFYENNGITFQEIITPFKKLKLAGLASVDLDNNGFKDIFIQGKDSADSRWTLLYMNDEGLFTQSDSTFTGLCLGDFSFGDCDSDGDLDVLMSGFKKDIELLGNAWRTTYTSYLALFENHGSDSLTLNREWTSVETYGRSNSDWGDYDNDGDPDIYITGSVGGILVVVVGVGTGGGGGSAFDGTLSCMTRVFQNQGDGSYLDTDMDIPCYRNDQDGVTINSFYQSYSLALADFNNDNSLDIIRTGSGRDLDEGTNLALYKNKLNISNNAPDFPLQLNQTIVSNKIDFFWRPASDDHTPSQSMQYKVYLRDNFNNYLISKANKDFVSDTNQLFSNIGSGMYYWSVKSIDGARISSNWSPENMFVIPTSEINICQGDSVNIYGQYYTETGLYFDTITSVHGNDSLLITQLTVNELPYLQLSPMDTTVCYGTTVYFTASGANNYLWSTNDTVCQIDTIITGVNYISVSTTGDNGCVNTLQAVANIFPADTTYVIDDFCHNSNYNFNGLVLNSPGIYYYNTSSMLHGCDSVVELTLLENLTHYILTEDTICDGTVYVWQNQNYTTQGIYYDSLLTLSGCDSIFQLNLIVNPISFSSENIVVCDTYTWPTNGFTYTSSGSYITTFVNTFGCDSIVTLNLTINYSTSGSEEVTACDNYTWLTNGITYTNTGSYTYTLVNTVGCDSIATLNLTINNSTSGSEEVTACDNYTWLTNGITYTSTGSYNHTLINSVGCDSIATLNLTINNSTYGFEEVTVCDTYIWSTNGMTYTTSGTYTHTLVNSAGCDSLVTLNLTVNYGTSSTDIITACDTYTWLVNGTTYSASGVYEESFINSVGCDSILTLNLTIDTVDTSVSVSSNILTANATDVFYQWLDCANNYPIEGETNQTFEAIQNGEYAVIINDEICTDTSMCYSITGVRVGELDNLNEVQVFPNPTSGVVYVLGKEIQSVTILDIDGKIIQKKQGDENPVKLNLGYLSNGVYLIKVITSKGIVIKKVAKK